MSVDIATLGLEVRSDGVVVATKRLHEMEGQAEKTETKIVPGLKRTGSAAETLSTKFMSLKKVMIGVGVVAGAALGLKIMISEMKEAIKLAEVQEHSEKKLEAVLRATGEAAGYNVKQLKNMASGLQKITTIGDEVILNGQAVLATFKNIRGEAFERTTKAALDMSAVMGSDLQSAIVMMGKALNDPVANLSAMSRAGVQFSDTQKDLIKTLTKSGEIEKAQSIILTELESEFGGAAEAARDTFGGSVDAAGNALGDLKEEMGFVITKNAFFVSAVQELEKAFMDLQKAISGSQQSFGDIVASNIAATIATIIDLLKDFAIAWGTVKVGATQAFAAIYKGAAMVYETVVKVLKPIDLLAQGLVSLGIIDVNPFDSMRKGYEDMYKTAKGAVEEAKNDVFQTVDAYDTAKKHLSDWYDKIAEGPAKKDPMAAQRDKAAKEAEKENTLVIAEQTARLKAQEALSAKFAKLEQAEINKQFEWKRKQYKALTKENEASLKEQMKALAAKFALEDKFEKSVQKSANETFEKKRKQYKEQAKQIAEFKKQFEEPVAFTFADTGMSDVANMITGVDNLTNSWAEYAKQMEYIATLHKDNADAIELQSLANEDLLKKQISGYSNLAGAAGKYFSKGSKERKSLHTLEMAFGAIEIAMEAKKAAAAIASTAAVMSAKLAEAPILGATAILNQGTGDPYSAFARMAAMAAMVAGVLASIGAAGSALSGGGGGSSNAPKMADTTGTVLGAPDKGSESLSKSLDILNNYNELQYGELQGIYGQVKELNKTLTGVTNSILRSVGVLNQGDFSGVNFGKTGPGDNFGQSTLGDITIGAFSPDKFMDRLFGGNDITKALSKSLSVSSKIFDKVTEDLINGILGTTSKKLVNAGIEVGQISLGQIADGVEVGIKNFGVIKTTVESWFDKNSSYKTKYAEADQSIIDQMNSLMSGAVTYLTDMADDLGIPVDKIKSYVSEVQRIDIKGLSGEELTKKFSEWFSTWMDKAFTAGFGELIGQYQNASEGLMETATRLRAGLGLIDVAVEKTGATFSAIGDAALSVSDSLSSSENGLADFSDSINAFYDSFTTAGEKLSDTKNMLQNTFDDLDIAMPTDKAGFKALLSGLDLADEKSRELYLKILDLAPEFAKVAEAADNFQTTLSDIDDWLTSFGPQENDLTSKFKKIDEDLASFRQEIEETGNAVPDNLKVGGVVEQAAKQWTAAMEEYKTAADIASSMFSAIADQQTQLDYEHWKSLKQINALAESAGNQYPDLIAAENELYELKSKQADSEINTAQELKAFYDDLGKRIASLKSDVQSQSESFLTREQVSANFQQLNQQYVSLDPSSSDYLEQSTTLLEEIWKTGNKLYGMEDTAMQSLLEVQKEQLQTQIDALAAQKASIEKQIDTLKQINSFLFDLSGGSLAPVQSSAGMMAQYNKLLENAKKTGNISDLESFIKGDFSNFFKAYGNYKDINEKVVNDVLALGDDITGGATLDDLNAQLETLNNSIDAMSNELSNMVAPESKINGLNLEDWTNSMLPLISGVQDQVDTVNAGLDAEIADLNESTLALIESIDNWGSDLSAQNIMGDNQLLVNSQSSLINSVDALNDTISTAFMDQLPVDQIVTTAFQNLFGRTPNDAGLAFWSDQLKSGAVAMSDFTNKLIAAASESDKQNLPHFVRGGSFIAGEHGPEMVSINPGNHANIMSNGDMAGMIANAVGQAITGAGVNADVRVFIGEKEIKDVMVKVTRKDNEYQKEIKRAVKVA